MRRRCCLALAAAGLLTGRVRAAPAGATMVEMHTALGDIVLVLFARQAPLSAAAFLAVMAAGGYDGGAFTRVVRPSNDHGLPRISVAQGAARPGGPKAAFVPHETTRATGVLHLDGTISLPRDAVGTRTGAEFFICIGDQPALDFGGMRNKDGQGFAAFGRVLQGMDVVRQIWSADASGPSPDPYSSGQMLKAPVAILSAHRVEGDGR